MTELRRALGRRLQTLRVARGLSQAELAERAQLSIESISRLERGVQLPGIETFARLADALGAPFGELFQVSGDNDPLAPLLHEFRALLAGRDATEGKLALNIARLIFDTYEPPAAAQALRIASAPATAHQPSR